MATASLLGTALLTLGIGLIAPRYDLRTLLLFGAGLMAATGLAFPNAEHVAFLALVAFLGTINPSTGDLGVLVPIEHAMLARGAVRRGAHQRVCPLQPDRCDCDRRRRARGVAARICWLSVGIGRLHAFRLMFYAYAALGIGAALLYRQLPRAQMRARSAHRSAWAVARRGLQACRAVQPRCFRRRLRRAIAARALAVRTLRPVAVGGAVFFFWSSTLSAFSYPVAAWIARRIGLINTMVYTHIPSSVFLILAAFSPDLYVALGLLLLRSALSQMDVPTRTSYVMAVVTPAERAAAASVTAVPRSLASAISPAFAGALLTTAFPACRWCCAACSRSPTTWRCCSRSGTSSRRRNCGIGKARSQAGAVA